MTGEERPHRLLRLTHGHGEVHGKAGAGCARAGFQAHLRAVIPRKVVHTVVVTGFDGGDIVRAAGVRAQRGADGNGHWYRQAIDKKKAGRQLNRVATRGGVAHQAERGNNKGDTPSNRVTKHDHTAAHELGAPPGHATPGQAARVRAA